MLVEFYTASNLMDKWHSIYQALKGQYLLWIIMGNRWEIYENIKNC